MPELERGKKMNLTCTKDTLLSVTEDRVIRCLKQSSKLLSAYEIQNALGIAHPNTVYRALQRLLQLGLVHRVESRNAFIACDAPKRNRDPGFMVCAMCSTVKEFDTRGIMPILRSEAAKRRFSIDKAAIELVGRCHSCASRNPRQPILR